MKLRMIALALFAWPMIGANGCDPWALDDGTDKPASSTSTGDPCQGMGGGSAGMGGAGSGNTGAGGADDTSSGVGASDPGDPSPEGLTCGGGDDVTLLQGYLQDADPMGGVSCSNPSDCSTQCFAKSKYCVEHAVHPYKPPMVGDLYQCVDSIPPASLGGSYTCLYQYPNGDACIFARAAKLGPITLPAPPPLCVYKSP